MIARDQPAATLVLRRHADVRRVLADPRFEVPPVPAGTSGIAWLRATVSRFSNGDDHARRRALAERSLAIEPEALRASASVLTEAALSSAAGRRIDAMRLARQVPVTALALATGVAPDAADDLAECVISIAAAYAPGANDDGTAAAALERALTLLGAGRDELGANRVGVLVQACAATAGLIGSALAAALREPSLLRSFTIDQVIAETVRHEPPVRSTQRRAAAPAEIAGTAIREGEIVVLDFAAANRDPEVFAHPDRFDPARFGRADGEPSRLDPARGERLTLTFGLGERACPGRAHACSLAAGLVEAVVARCRLAEQAIVYEASPNLHVLASLEVSVA